ncbi:MULTISPECIES: hypothetical protein [Streptomyces]|nr:hypothetical protein [Streptomyces galilaeus]
MPISSSSRAARWTSPYAASAMEDPALMRAAPASASLDTGT